MSCWKSSMNWRICVSIEKRTDPPDIDRTGERRAREERIGRLIEEARGLLRQNEVIFDKWRAEGILPPKEPLSRI